MGPPPPPPPPRPPHTLPDQGQLAGQGRTKAPTPAPASCTRTFAQAHVPRPLYCVLCCAPQQPGHPWTMLRVAALSATVSGQRCPHTSRSGPHANRTVLAPAAPRTSRPPLSPHQPQLGATPICTAWVTTISNVLRTHAHAGAGQSCSVVYAPPHALCCAPAASHELDEHAVLCCAVRLPPHELSQHAVKCRLSRAGPACCAPAASHELYRCNAGDFLPQLLCDGHAHRHDGCSRPRDLDLDDHAIFALQLQAPPPPCPRGTGGSRPAPAQTAGAGKAGVAVGCCHLLL